MRTRPACRDLIHCGEARLIVFYSSPDSLAVSSRYPLSGFPRQNLLYIMSLPSTPTPIQLSPIAIVQGQNQRSIFTRDYQ